MFWGSVREGPLATSKAITAKNVTFKKSLGFSNFFYRDYFNSLKTSNICKFSGIEFLGPNPKLRRRKKNLSWGGYVLHKTFCQGIHVTKCATSRAKFFFLPISRCRRRRRWKNSLICSIGISRFDHARKHFLLAI